jgi:hypothetical protein
MSLSAANQQKTKLLAHSSSFDWLPTGTNLVSADLLKPWKELTGKLGRASTTFKNMNIA